MEVAKVELAALSDNRDEFVGIVNFQTEQQRIFSVGGGWGFPFKG